jgi:hypothetical protein
MGMAALRRIRESVARGAVIEGKGNPMSSLEIGERRAFELLRRQSQRNGRKLYDVTQAGG